MPTADPFNAAGRRNGLPFTLVAATDSAINAVDGSNFAGSLANEALLRVKEFTFDNILPYIWNLYSVTFPTVTHGGFTYTFSGPGIYKMGQNTGSEADLDALTPKERFVFDPQLTLSPLTNSGDVAAARSPLSLSDFSARFDVHGICFATDTSKHYLMYSSALYADDGVTREVEIPFANLTFNYYTYS